MGKTPNLKLRAPRMTEAQLQRQIVDFLRLQGCVALEIGKSRAAVQCYQCGAEFRPRSWQGNTVGAPDLFFTSPAWGIDTREAVLRFWVGAELKRDANAPVRPEQQELIDAFHVEKVCSMADVEFLIELADGYFRERNRV